MAQWPVDHDWYFSKLKIDDIWLIDYFGGPAIIPVADYYQASPKFSKVQKGQNSLGAILE